MRTSLAVVIFSLIASSMMGTFADAGIVTPSADGFAPIGMTAAPDFSAVDSPTTAEPIAVGEAISVAAPMTSNQQPGMSNSVVLLPLDSRHQIAAPMGEVASKIDLHTRFQPAEVRVEPVPTPSALTAGLIVLGGLVAVRMVRRLKMI